MASTPAKGLIKVCLDSSVLIAGAISPHGSARDLLDAGLDDRASLYLSTLVLQETERNLARKAPAALPMFRLFIDALRPQLVDPSTEQVLEAARVVEPKDAPIVAAALAAHADVLATYDRKHLSAQANAIHQHFHLVAAPAEEILLILDT
ncbi:MAG: PIN domain-containing protein [Chloroflexota bacterium]